MNIRKIMIQICLYIIFFLIFTLIPQGEDNGHVLQAAEQKTIVFGIPTIDCDICTRKVILIYTEVFKRMGYGFEYKLLPTQRSLVEMNAGRIDGEGFRVRFNEKLKNQFPNIIQVSESIGKVSLDVFAIDPTIKLDGWKSLKGKAYTIIYLRGQKMAELNLPKYVDPDNIIASNNTRYALKMLINERADILVAIKQYTESVLLDKEFKNTDVHNVGTLSTVSLYPCLHKKHAKLVPRLIAAIKGMKQDGTIHRLVEQAKKDQ